MLYKSKFVLEINVVEENDELFSKEQIKEMQEEWKEDVVKNLGLYDSNAIYEFKIDTVVE